MRILVGCEYSAVVRDAFRFRGHDAWSCDLLPTEGDPRFHFTQDIFEVLEWRSWDRLIAFPPCTDLCSSGARWFHLKREKQNAAVAFVRRLMQFPEYAIENPVGVLSSRIRKPDQIIQPWQFGHGETKATCLWLRGLKKLAPTRVVDGREARVHRMPPGPNRARERSRTYQGIADAMAEQWTEKLLDSSCSKC